jgi:phosphomannomutase/phosphoglucomutase
MKFNCKARIIKTLLLIRVTGVLYSPSALRSLRLCAKLFYCPFLFMNQNIFREYDIRGIVGRDLNDETVYLIAKAIGTFFNRHQAKRIAVGYDARESGTRFRDLLVKGLNETGCDAVLVGRVPTPVLYHAVFTRNVDGGVMITGSHNPADHNGFKICLGKQTLFGSQIQEIKEIALMEDFADGKGSVEEIDVLNSITKTTSHQE